MTNSVSSGIIRKAAGGILRRYIDEYVFRQVAVQPGTSVEKAMPLRLVTSIDFFLGDSFETIDISSGKLIPFSRCDIRGLRTYRKNHISIRGSFSSFSIRFKPAGLYGLLGIPAGHFCDETVAATSLPVNVFAEITERLMACNTLERCIAATEPYLHQIARKAIHNIYTSDAVEHMLRLIRLNEQHKSIGELQQQVCLSQRQLERNFCKEIGATPKMYSRMLRFTSLLQQKIHAPQAKWACLAYEYQYSDQMHLVKDFKSFLGINPGNFIANDFAF